jgi:predicted nucleic acid-binding protein
MSESVSHFAGNALYIDTMVFYLLLRTQNTVVESLFQRIEHGEIQAHTSVLAFDELAYRMLLALIKDRYGGSPLENLHQNQAKLTGEFYPQLEPQFAQLSRFPHLSIHEIAAGDLAAMQSNMRQYNLLPRDALHLAAMQKCGCFHLVSQDTDFDMIPSIQRYTLT